MSVHRRPVNLIINLVVSVRICDPLRTCCTLATLSQLIFIHDHFTTTIHYSTFFTKVLMFTPPPSPQPSRTDGFNISAPITEPSTELHNLEKICDSRYSDDTKRRTGRRFLWAVVLIPFIVIAFTVFGGIPTSLVRKSAPVFFPPSSYGLPSHQSKLKRLIKKDDEVTIPYILFLKIKNIPIGTLLAPFLYF